MTRNTSNKETQRELDDHLFLIVAPEGIACFLQGLCSFSDLTNLKEANAKDYFEDILEMPYLDCILDGDGTLPDMEILRHEMRVLETIEDGLTAPNVDPICFKRIRSKVADWMKEVSPLGETFQQAASAVYFLTLAREWTELRSRKIRALPKEIEAGWRWVLRQDWLDSRYRALASMALIEWR